jgi:hypothetical protein
MVTCNKELVVSMDHLILLEQLNVWDKFQLTWDQELWNVYGIVVGNILTTSLFKKWRSRWQNNIKM